MCCTCFASAACVAGKLCTVLGCFYLKSMSSSPDARRAFALSTSTSSFWAVVISSSCPRPLSIRAVLASLRALPSKGARGPKPVDAVLHSSPQHRLAVNLKVPVTCSMKLLPDGLFGAACWRDVSLADGGLDPPCETLNTLLLCSCDV